MIRRLLEKVFDKSPANPLPRDPATEANVIRNVTGVPATAKASDAFADRLRDSAKEPPAEERTLTSPGLTARERTEVLARDADGSRLRAAEERHQRVKDQLQQDQIEREKRRAEREKERQEDRAQAQERDRAWDRTLSLGCLGNNNKTVGQKHDRVIVHNGRGDK